MYQVDLPFEQLIKSYTNKNDRLCYLDEYPKEVQLLVLSIFKICRRTLLNPKHVVFILNDTLSAYDDLKDKFEDRKNQIIELEKEIDGLKNTIKIEKSKLCEQLQENEIKKLEKSTNSKEMNITNIANYLGVSRQTIYNLKKKHSLEKTIKDALNKKENEEICFNCRNIKEDYESSYCDKCCEAEQKRAG